MIASKRLSTDRSAVFTVEKPEEKGEVRGGKKSGGE